MSRVIVPIETPKGTPFMDGVIPKITCQAHIPLCEPDLDPRNDKLVYWRLDGATLVETTQEANDATHVGVLVSDKCCVGCHEHTVKVVFANAAARNGALYLADGTATPEQLTLPVLQDTNGAGGTPWGIVYGFAPSSTDLPSYYDTLGWDNGIAEGATGTGLVSARLLGIAATIA